jgi:2-keto-4-pentenoate hydratase
MDADTRARAVDALVAAYASGRAIDPLSETYPEMTLADAYHIQLDQISRMVTDGAVVRGHKVGLTSRAMQRQLGVDQPDYGHLLDGMFHTEHQPIPDGTFLQPRVEPEIAFVLQRPLRGPGVTVPEALAAVDFVLPALEVIDSRIKDWRITIRDTIADNASSGGIVLGSTPVEVTSLDLRRMGCVLHRNGEVVATGAGGAVMGSPVTSLVWLANTVGEHGIVLEPGHTVLPGSITASVPVDPGDDVTATFAGLGSVTASFGKAGKEGQA